MQTSHARLWTVATLALVLAAGAAFSRTPEEGTASEAMAQAARAFLGGLGDAQRARASFDYDSPVRQDWHFIPRERKGLTLGEMDKAGCERLDTLLASGLSQAGRARFAGVVRLEGILRELESRPDKPALHRDPGDYSVAIFGKPGVEPWAWRLEGHHWSVHFTSIAEGEWTVTPNLVGANPARVLEGLHAGFELLGDQDHAARALAASLPEALRERAALDGPSPRDVLWMPGIDEREAEPRGISLADLGAEQRKLLQQVVASCFDDLSEELAARERDRLADSSPQSLRFAFSGDPAEGKAWYWRLQSGDFAIEFSNPDGNSNHVHRSWRDLSRDFGGPPPRVR